MDVKYSPLYKMGEELDNFSKQLEIVNTYQLSNKLAYILGILVDKLSLDIRTAIGLMSSCIDILKQVELDPELELRVLYLLYEGNFGKAREVLREHATNQQRLDQMNRERTPTRTFDAPKEPSPLMYHPQSTSSGQTFQPQTLSYEAQRQRLVYPQDRESQPHMQYPKEQTNPPYYNNPEAGKSSTASIPSLSDHSQYRPYPNTTSTASFPSYSQSQDKPNLITPSVPWMDNYSQNPPSGLSSNQSTYKSPWIQEIKPLQPSLQTPQYPQPTRQPSSSLLHQELPPGISISQVSSFPTPQGPVEIPNQRQPTSHASSSHQSSSDLKNQGQTGSEASDEKDIPMYESVVLPKDSLTSSSYEDMKSEKINEKVEENMPKVDFMSNSFLPEGEYKEKKEEFKNIVYNPLQPHDFAMKLPSQENPGKNISSIPIRPYDPKMNSERNPESQKDFNFKPSYQFPQGASGTSQETVPKLPNIYQLPIPNYSQSIPISPYPPQSNPYSNNPTSNLPLQFNPASIAQPVHSKPPNMGYNNPYQGSVPSSSPYQFNTPTTTVPNSIPNRGFEATPGLDRPVPNSIPNRGFEATPGLDKPVPNSIPNRGFEATPGLDRPVPINPVIVGHTANPQSQDFIRTPAGTPSIKPSDELYNFICKLCHTSMHYKPKVKLSCGHSIHLECIRSNVKSPYNTTATCPIDTCKAVIDENILRSIFESQESSTTLYQPLQKCPKCEATVSCSGGVINCSSCKSLSCLKCKGSHSPGSNCEASISILGELRK
jgi:hypothetical protein